MVMTRLYVGSWRGTFHSESPVEFSESIALSEGLPSKDYLGQGYNPRSFEAGKMFGYDSSSKVF